MADNKITDTIKLVTGEDESFVDVGKTAQSIVFDSSTPPVRSIVRVVLVTLIILAIAGFLSNLVSALTHLFFLIVLAVFFAYLVKPLIQMIRRPFENTKYDKYMPRPLAIGITYLIVFSVLGIVITFLTPLVADQAKQFSVNLPEYTASLQAKFRDFSTRYRTYRIPDSVQTQINDKASSVVGAVGGEVTNFLINIVYYIPWLVLIPILAFFFLKDANLFRVSLLRVFPSGDWRMRVESIMHDVNTTLAAYVRAQLISCVFIGTLCTVAFYIMGVNYALLLGVMAGIFEFIPLIGPLTIAIIVTTVAALESTTEAISVAIFLGVLRILQDYVFYPRIVREGIHLHPLAIILSVLAGEEIAGIPGVFLSIPVIALVTVLYKHILEYSGGTGIVVNMLAPQEVAEEVTAAAE